MGNCSAPNCSNSSRKGFRVFIFPRDPERRAKWLQMCRKDKWQPTKSSRLCEVHFEESQFESARQDGWKKLKPNAVPRLFNFPNCPNPVTPTRRRRIRSAARTVKTEMSPERSCIPEAAVAFDEPPSVVPEVLCDEGMQVETTPNPEITEREAALLKQIKTLQRRLWLTENTLEITRAELKEVRRKVSSLPFLCAEQVESILNGKLR